MALSTTRTLLTQTGINTHQVFNVGGLDSAGIATFSNFKTGSTNVHNIGIEAAGINVLGGDTPIGSGATIYDDGGARFSGVVTATSFHGDISQATGAAAGLGTALSQTQTDPLNKVYYTNRVLSISTTTTIDHPATTNLAYTQYGDIKIEDGHDLIIKDGDDFKYDILGISTTKLARNEFLNGLSGDLTGDVTGNLTGNVTGNVTGAVTGNVTGDLIGNVTGNIITNKILPTTGVPSGGGGGIIQVIGPETYNGNNAVNINHNSGGAVGPTYLGAQFDVVITPKFSTSKILIIGMISSVGSANGNANLRITTHLYRHVAGGSAVDTGHSCGTYVANNTYTPHNILYIDSPNTTNAVTYKIYGSGTGATGGQYAWMRTTGTSTFIAAEISA
jgi:hypothetical protein